MTTERIDPYDESAQQAAAALEADAQRLQRAREVDDFKWLMGHKQGRRLMWKLLGLTGLFRNPFQPGSPEGTTEFRCGEQNIGQQYLVEIHTHCPEEYERMVREQQNATRK